VLRKTLERFKVLKSDYTLHSIIGPTICDKSLNVIEISTFRKEQELRKKVVNYLNNVIC